MVGLVRATGTVPSGPNRNDTATTFATGQSTVLRAAPSIASTASPSITSGAGTLTETVVVHQANATIASSATPMVTVGSPRSDTATVTGAATPARAPTGTVTFTLYGPNDDGWAGTPAFISGATALAEGPPPTATADFTRTAPGTYRWVAEYSGDVNSAVRGSGGNDTLRGGDGKDRYSSIERRA